MTQLGLVVISEHFTRHLQTK